MIITDSKLPGKTTVIMTGVHGDENTGPDILPSLINTTKIIAGTVYRIIANPFALKQNKRYIDINMNRVFSDRTGPEYERQRVLEILPILKDADYLLDIHNTVSNPSEPFLISEYPELGKYFPVSTVSSGFDKLHPGGSDGYMNSIGKVGLCLEVGTVGNANCESIVRESIINFLAYTGNITGNKSSKITKYNNQKFYNFNYIYKNKAKFRLAKMRDDFTKIKKGEIIGYDGVEKIISQQDSIIVFGEDQNLPGQEAFVLGNLLQNPNQPDHRSIVRRIQFFDWSVNWQFTSFIISFL